MAGVVPYCGQAQHLLSHLHPFLQCQRLHCAIYLVNNTTFNPGKLCNVGFWEAMQEEDWDCVFFHDVNLLPEDDHNLYICNIFPAPVPWPSTSSTTTKGQGRLPEMPCASNSPCLCRLPYQGYRGGVFALCPIHYLRISGFPSTSWGWDQEDSDVTARLQRGRMLLLWLHLLFGCYHMLEEGQDPSLKQSSQR
ncbi:unnamed protein product [Rangifer tarandus platyrhynchus]|uniref:Uncharacterized protein n=1 Tax=Rangifer tarandus platyrhynchus TaxID=3082113 RepID=A0AC59YTR4_RANTA